MLATVARARTTLALPRDSYVEGAGAHPSLSESAAGLGRRLGRALSETLSAAR